MDCCHGSDIYDNEFESHEEDSYNGGLENDVEDLSDKYVVKGDCNYLILFLFLLLNI